MAALRRILLWLTVLSLYGLLGCATPPNAVATADDSSFPVRFSVQIEDTPYEQNIRFIGIEERIPGDRYSSYFLRSFLEKKTGKIQHQFYVDHYYSGTWIFWMQANTQDAEPLEIDSIDRKVVHCGRYVGCSYRETFGAVMPDAVLQAHLNGLSVKFYAKTGREMVLTLTPQQIQQQLKVINDYRASRQLIKSLR